MLKKLTLILTIGLIISACEPCYVSMGSNTGTVATGACEGESGILPAFNPYPTGSSITSEN